MQIVKSRSQYIGGFKAEGEPNHMGEHHGIKVEKHRSGAKPRQHRHRCGSEWYICTMAWENKGSVGMGAEVRFEAELKRLPTESVI
jgi:hypothetical protein